MSSFMILAIGLGLSPAMPVQDTVAGVADREAQELFATVMSPYCPGRTLAHCPSVQAARLRDSLRAALRAGVRPDSIRTALLAAYGDVVRGAPEARGFGLLAWIVPGVLLLAAGVALVRRLNRRGGSHPAAVPPPLDADDRRRLDAELADL